MNETQYASAVCAAYNMNAGGEFAKWWTEADGNE